MKRVFWILIILLFFSANALGQDCYQFGENQAKSQQKKYKNGNDRQQGFDSSWDNQNAFMKPYQENTYGPGVHSDSTGKPFTWETQNGETSHSNNVKPDGYGLGVGMDEYGRPVKPSPYGN